MKYSITRQMLLMLVLCLVAPALFAQSSLIPGSGFGPIPDSPGMGPKNYGEPLDIVFNVQNKIGNVESVGVFFDAEHSFVGDLRVTLIAPDGRFHVLFEHTGATTPTMGGSDSDLLDTNRYVFGDASTDNWWDEAASGLTEVPSGNYRTVVSGGQGVTNPPPVTSMNDTFRTASPNGQWILRFEDGWDGEFVGDDQVLQIDKRQRDADRHEREVEEEGDQDLFEVEHRPVIDARVGRPDELDPEQRGEHAC